jgi:D-amino-acid dehydrogenase
MHGPVPSRRIAVIGAGIVGVSCAAWLRRDGHTVTLIDPLPPGEATSFGNAAMIQVDATVPLATPGVLKAVPKMLMDPEGPLVIRWKHLPAFALWLLRFLAAARPGRVEEISIALAAILQQAAGAHRDLAKITGAEDLFRPLGELWVYRQESSFRAAQEAHDMRRRRGVRLETLCGPEIRQLEPALAPDVKYGVFSPDCLLVVDPLTLTRRHAEWFERNGGTILRETVTDIVIADRAVRAVVTDKGRHAVDEVVLAAGVWSRRLARRIGLDVPVVSERGYHLMLPYHDVGLRMPLLNGDHRFGIIPMRDGIRLAGTAEFGGLDGPPNWRRADMLLALAQRLVPGLKGAGATRWMGHRPSMPDSLPVIGTAPGVANARFAFGHGHLGLTMGAVTGRLIADLVAGRPPAVDLAPYRADRF